VSRRSLGSIPDLPAQPGVPPTRRQGGARREANDRVLFTVAEKAIDGWALNVSRGGLRAIVDEVIELGTEAKVAIGPGAPRPCRIVWVQEEPDGGIVGVEFLDGSGSVPNFEALAQGISDEPSASEPPPAPPPPKDGG